MSVMGPVSALKKRCPLVRLIEGICTQLVNRELAADYVPVGGEK